MFNQVAGSFMESLNGLILAGALSIHAMWALHLLAGSLGLLQSFPKVWIFRLLGGTFKMTTYGLDLFLCCGQI
jgi:hypothetical protein